MAISKQPLSRPVDEISQLVWEAPSYKSSNQLAPSPLR